MNLVTNPSGRKATIRHVAQEAGVSQTTVSLAFRRESRISPQTRVHVLSVAKALGYRPNLVARNLRHGSTNALAFIVNDIANPFYAVMLREAEQAALQRGHCTIFGASNWNPFKERALITQMLEMRVPAFIICFCELERRNYDLIREADVPCVAVDSFPEWYHGPHVANDFKAAADLAASHLVQTGRGRPVLLTAGPERRSFSAFQQIELYFTHGLVLRSVDFSPDRVFEAGLDMAAGRDAMRRALASGLEIDSVFCVNDLCAAGAIEAIREKGLRPGHDVAVIGIDDMEISSFSGLSLTSLRQPYDEIARVAVNAVADTIEKKVDLDLRIVLPPQLKIRQTTLPRAVSKESPK